MIASARAERLLYLSGGLIFLVGTWYFQHPQTVSSRMPSEVLRDQDVLYAAIWMFIVGSIIFVLLGGTTWPEMISKDPPRSFASVACSDHRSHVQLVHQIDGGILGLSLGVICNRGLPPSSTRCRSTLLAAHSPIGLLRHAASTSSVGSCLSWVRCHELMVYAGVSEISSVNVSSELPLSFEALLKGLPCAKVCFMPNQGCKEGMEILGAWCFIVGAGCYMLGDFIELMLLDCACPCLRLPKYCQEMAGSSIPLS